MSAQNQRAARGREDLVDRDRPAFDPVACGRGWVENSIAIVLDRVRTQVVAELDEPLTPIDVGVVEQCTPPLDPPAISLKYDR